MIVDEKTAYLIEVNKRIKTIAERVMIMENDGAGVTSLVFDTYESMKSWLANDDNLRSLKIGQSLYIKDKNVPDYWFSGDEILELETAKIDFSGVVKTSGNQTIGGTKTFSSIPVGPSSDPTTGNQLTRKAYVDNIMSLRSLKMQIMDLIYPVGSLIMFFDEQEWKGGLTGAFPYLPGVWSGSGIFEPNYSPNHDNPIIRIYERTG